MAGELGGIARRFTGCDPARMAAGLFLPSVARLKIDQPATEPDLGNGFLDCV